MSPDLASALVRGLSFVALFQATGAALFRFRCQAVDLQSDRLLRQIQQRSALFGVAMLCIHQALQAALLTGAYSGLLDVDLQALALGSMSALSMALQGIALMGLAFGARQSGLRGGGASGAGLVLALSAFVLMGHTRTHAWRVVLAPLLVLHLLAVAYWFGALLPLWMVLKRESLPIVSEVLALFSRTASWLVLLLAAAGGLLFLLLTHGSPEFSRPYDALILAKVAAFLLLMGLAGLNRLRLVPLVAAGQQSAVGQLRWSVLGEAVILMGVLGATAFLTSFYSPGAA